MAGKWTRIEDVFPIEKWGDIPAFARLVYQKISLIGFYSDDPETPIHSERIKFQVPSRGFFIAKKSAPKSVLGGSSHLVNG